MLTRLTVQNIAIIESVELELQPGFNAVTGETGSGKSLLLDAIQAVFEKRVSAKSLLRYGAAKGRIELVFDLEKVRNRAQVQVLLEEAGIELLPEESELLISRELSASGTRCRVNGTPVPSDWIEKLGMNLLEIYGQHDLHTLFSSARQRELLDSLGGEPLQAMKQEVRQAYREMNRLQAEIDRLTQEREERERQRDFMVFQLQEIQEAALDNENEDETLKQERERLAHLEGLCQSALKSQHLLTGEEHYDAPSVLTLLSQIQKALSTGVSIDPIFSRWYDQVDQVQETLRSFSQELSEYGSSVDTRPERMQEIIVRLDVLEKLKRKYGGTLASVIQAGDELATTLDSLEQSESHLTELETAYQQAKSTYTQSCRLLSDLRRQIAETLELSIRTELDDLLLSHAQFGIDIQSATPSESGQDTVTFMFSANPGEPLRPLAQVASGGELGRLMLALKIRTAHTDGLTTLILDEIDTGMSGITVRAVADKLHTLQQQCQIIVVTHQPILAARASCQLHVEKQVLADDVRVQVSRLTDVEQRKGVLSRLASGFTEDNAVTSQFIEQLLSAG